MPSSADQEYRTPVDYSCNGGGSFESAKTSWNQDPYKNTLLSQNESLHPSSNEVEEQNEEVPRNYKEEIYLNYYNHNNINGAPFPLKMQIVLKVLDQEGSHDTIVWNTHGRSFNIIRRCEFEKEVLPRFFKTNQMASFRRQLRLYAFVQINKGKESESYYHRLFLRSQPLLCLRMERPPCYRRGGRVINTQTSDKDSGGSTSSLSPSTTSTSFTPQPFKSMKPMPPLVHIVPLCFSQAPPKVVTILADSKNEVDSSKKRLLRLEKKNRINLSPLRNSDVVMIMRDSSTTTSDKRERNLSRTTLVHPNQMLLPSSSLNEQHLLINENEMNERRFNYTFAWHSKHHQEIMDTSGWRDMTLTYLLGNSSMSPTFTSCAVLDADDNLAQKNIMEENQDQHHLLAMNRNATNMNSNGFIHHHTHVYYPLDTSIGDIGFILNPNLLKDDLNMRHEQHQKSLYGNRGDQESIGTFNAGNPLHTQAVINNIDLIALRGNENHAFATNKESNMTDLSHYDEVIRNNIISNNTAFENQAYIRYLTDS